MQIDREFARRVYDALGHDAVPRSNFRAYYLMNSNHPVLKSMIKKFCLENGLGNGRSMSDVQRVQMELSMLNEDALEAVRILCEKREAQRNDNLRQAERNAG